LISGKREAEELLAALQGHPVLRPAATVCGLEDGDNHNGGGVSCNEEQCNRRDSAGDDGGPARHRALDQNGSAVDAATSQQEAMARLREHLDTTKQELGTIRVQSKSRIADLEHRLKMAESERVESRGELEAARERADRLQADCDQHADERTTQTHVVARLESEIRTVGYSTYWLRSC